MTKAVRIVVQY